MKMDGFGDTEMNFGVRGLFDCLAFLGLCARYLRSGPEYRLWPLCAFVCLCVRLLPGPPLFFMFRRGRLASESCLRWVAINQIVVLRVLSPV